MNDYYLYPRFTQSSTDKKPLLIFLRRNYTFGQEDLDDPTTNIEGGVDKAQIWNQIKKVFTVVHRGLTYPVGNQNL